MNETFSKSMYEIVKSSKTAKKVSEESPQWVYSKDAIYLGHLKNIDNLLNEIKKMRNISEKFAKIKEPSSILASLDKNTIETNELLLESDRVIKEFKSKLTKIDLSAKEQKSLTEMFGASGNLSKPLDAASLNEKLKSLNNAIASQEEEIQKIETNIKKAENDLDSIKAQKAEMQKTSDDEMGKFSYDNKYYLT
jgi:chromosome segregation ATPase